MRGETRALTAAVLMHFVALPLCVGKDFELPGLAAKLSLSSAWVAVSPALVRACNEDMVKQNPRTRVR